MWINKEESCCKKLYNKIKLFAKERPIIFGLSCFTILIIIIIIINISTKDSKADICEKNRYSDECLYKKMIDKKADYPEGMKSNDNYLPWKGGIYEGGDDCAVFSFMLSDVCFREIKANKINCSFNFKVGDVVRINNASNFVIILKMDKTNNIIIIAEGNYNK